MSKIRYYLLGVVALVSIGGTYGCSPSVSVHAVIPPRLVMPNVRRIAVLPFRPRRWGGKEGLVLASIIATRLSNSEARRLYSIIETSERQAVMRERSIRHDLADAELAASGQQLGAQALIAGRITSYHVSRRSWSQRQLYYRNGVRYRRTIYCLKRTAYVGANLRVIRTANREILHSYSRQSVATASRCGRNRYSIMSGHDLLQRATDKLALSLAVPLTPTVRRLVIPIETGGPDKRINLGVKYARRGRWERADELWRQVLRADPRSNRALYNLGVASEVRGALRLARRFYRRAERLLPKSWYIRAMKRIEARIQDRREMKYLEKKKRPHQPTAPAGDPGQPSDPTAPGQKPTNTGTRQ